MQPGWDNFFNLNASSIKELTFWVEALKSMNSRKFDYIPNYTRIVFSDASSTGSGGYIVQFNDQICHRSWVGDESRMSSTWRELKAVLTVLHLASLSVYRVKQKFH